MAKSISKTTIHLIERAPGVIDIEIERRLKGVMDTSKDESQALAHFMAGSAQHPMTFAHVPKVGSVSLVFLVGGKRIVRPLGGS